MLHTSSAGQSAVFQVGKEAGLIYCFYIPKGHMSCLYVNLFSALLQVRFALILCHHGANEQQSARIYAMYIHCTDYSQS